MTEMDKKIKAVEEKHAAEVKVLRDQLEQIEMKRDQSELEMLSIIRTMSHVISELKGRLVPDGLLVTLPGGLPAKLTVSHAHLSVTSNGRSRACCLMSPP